MEPLCGCGHRLEFTLAGGDGPDYPGEFVGDSNRGFVVSPRAVDLPRPGAELVGRALADVGRSEHGASALREERLELVLDASALVLEPKESPRSGKCPSSPCAIAYAQDGSPHGSHASMPYAGSCASSDSSSPRALTSSCPPSPSSSKTLILICPTCSVRTCVMRAPRFESFAKQLPEVQRLLTIPGIGLLTATAIVGFVGDLRRFPSGRRFSSYLGLVPKENSSGDIRRLGRITKRGDSYLRTLDRLEDAGSEVTSVTRSPQDFESNPWDRNFSAY